MKTSYQSPVGLLTIEEENGQIIGIYLDHQMYDDQTDVLLKAKQQLEDYFYHGLQQFDLPLLLKGTAFQKKVWNVLQTIPYGSTFSYKEVAEKLGLNKGYQAIGGANHNNPVMIVVPCHRVIQHNGGLGGYGGGVNIKEYLLNLEKKAKM